MSKEEAIALRERLETERPDLRWFILDRGVMGWFVITSGAAHQEAGDQ